MISLTKFGKKRKMSFAWPIFEWPSWTSYVMRIGLDFGHWKWFTTSWLMRFNNYKCPQGWKLIFFSWVRSLITKNHTHHSSIFLPAIIINHLKLERKLQRHEKTRTQKTRIDVLCNEISVNIDTCFSISLVTEYRSNLISVFWMYNANACKLWMSVIIRSWIPGCCTYHKLNSQNLMDVWSFEIISKGLTLTTTSLLSPLSLARWT